MPSPRVRSLAAIALGRTKDANSVPAILEMIAQQGTADAFLRHSGVMALTGCARPDGLAALSTSGNPGAEGVATRATTGAVMSAAAQNSHAEAAQSLERVEQLVTMIPDMEDLKASMDHNTRVTAELAIAMTRMWALEAIQTLGAGNAGVVDAATVAREGLTAVARGRARVFPCRFSLLTPARLNTGCHCHSSIQRRVESPGNRRCARPQRTAVPAPL